MIFQGKKKDLECPVKGFRSAAIKIKEIIEIKGGSKTMIGVNRRVKCSLTRFG